MNRTLLLLLASLLSLIASGCSQKPPNSGSSPSKAEAVATVADAQDEEREEEEPSLPDPARFEEAIQAFEEADALARYPDNPIVAVGSSSLRGWHRTIDQDLAPLPIIPRGFGGSMMNDVLHYTDRIVTNYSPRAILLYEGDNDIAHGLRPQTVLDTYEAFFEKVWAHRDDTRIYVISVKPSPSRQQHWPKMQELNELLAERARQDERLFFVDVATAMLTEEGEMRPELYLGDMLHMNEKGYEIWTRVVREEMVERERPD